MKLFPTQEIGSMAKPKWRVYGYKGLPVTEEIIQEAEEWGRKLGVEGHEELLKTLREPDSPERRAEIWEWSIRYAVRFLEHVGLDRVYSGEQGRIEMYEHVMRRVGGMKFIGTVRSFDNKYYSKAAPVERLRYEEPIYLDELHVVNEEASREIKVPITGPYTLVDWSYNEHYLLKHSGTDRSPKRIKQEARREFLLDLIHRVLRPEIRSLIRAGVRWIQIDEPAVTTHPVREEMELFVEAFNETTKGFPCRFSLHNCYSDYEILARHAPDLKNCSQLALEFANRDTTELGTTKKRTGYKELQHFVEHGFEGTIGLGVLHVHTDYVESPELVRDRILHASKIIEPERIDVNPDCGGRTRTWPVLYEKYGNMVKGAELARKVLGG